MCDFIDVDNEARLELVLEATGIGMWDLQLQTGMAFCSNQCKHILGFTLGNGDISEKTFLDNVHPEDRERVLETARGAILAKKDYDTEYRVIWLDGSIHWIAAHGRTIYDQLGEPVRMLGTVQDITARKVALSEREELLIREMQARTEAETANLIKDQFLAVLSHEIRSPLNPILGWTKLLKSGKLDAAASARALDTIERNVKLQTQLIDDLLDVSKILRGKINLNFAAVDLSSTITSAIEAVELAAQTKNIYIDYVNNISAGNNFCWGDVNRLQQILGNLLSNAIKFTPTGGKVSIRLERVNSHIQIAVSDTGKGITPDFLPYVFDYFRQADNSTTRKSGGLGLGLAIVRQLVELHHGSVQVYSAGEGQGATFTVKLPAYQVEQILSESNIATASNISISLFGVKILVVDDEVDTRELLQLILQQSGATVFVASNAIEVLSIIEQVQPDILLSDIAMPQTDGYKLIRQIREMAPAQSQYKCNLIPAIALTAYASDSDEEKARAAGFQLHLAKPIEPDDLINAIAKLLKI
ncbi:multi-sensor hybrid histidine kinase [Calothrix sp. NIES-4071]|nr:multi-sensor hybrid histidine kinase [Calothrix sp. NIES-4071]BAZ59179.1 multi-sensor hybrid histidine kinase [Calothrix sp. NIES-4105]